MIKKFIKKLKSFCFYFLIKYKEKRFAGLNYLFFDNHSDSIIIIFSAFGSDKPRRYNYIKGLNALKIDKLYILDPFGYKGSYNIYEGGERQPELLTKSLINHIMKGKEYKNVYTAGSSKGGTCAIYFGLELNCTAIFSGACQYHIGDYVCFSKEREPIFKGMMGVNAGEKEKDILNSLLPLQIEKYKDSSSIIHVIYSKDELTYDRHIKDLLTKLSQTNIQTVEHIESFTNHSDVGIFFIKYLKEYFKNESID